MKIKDKLTENQRLRFYEKKVSEDDIRYVPMNDRSKKIASKFPRVGKNIELTPTGLNFLKSSGFKLKVEK